jgi:ubiquitin C-terminal hydrolase
MILLFKERWKFISIKLHKVESPCLYDKIRTMKRGLNNVGNTCYLNSALQALRHTKPFADYFGSDAWKIHRHPDRKGHELAQETADLLTEFKQGERPINPMKFVRAFYKVAKERGLDDEFHPGAQADGTEAVLLILQVLHEQQARQVKMEVSGAASTPDHVEYIKSLESWTTFFHKEYSPIIEAFYGQTQTRLVCGACNASSTKYEPWGVMKVPIPNAEKAGAVAPSLQECITAAFASETLEGYQCDSCKERGKVRNENHISRFPNYLILGLKRYTNTGAKVRARIPYDENLVDLTEYLTWPSLQKSCRYRIYAVIDQWGSSRGGHYNMRVRNNSDWLLYDDTSCSKSPNGGAAGPDTLMLFLEKI